MTRPVVNLTDLAAWNAAIARSRAQYRQMPLAHEHSATTPLTPRRPIAVCVNDGCAVRTRRDGGLCSVCDRGAT